MDCGFVLATCNSLYLDLPLSESSLNLRVNIFGPISDLCSVFWTLDSWILNIGLGFLDMFMYFGYWSLIKYLKCGLSHICLSACFPALEGRTSCPLCIIPLPLSVCFSFPPMSSLPNLHLLHHKLCHTYQTFILTIFLLQSPSPLILCFLPGSIICLIQYI